MRDSAITCRFHRSVWVLSAVLAVLSISLIVAAGCASGGPTDPAETGGTGTAWISTAGQDAPDAAARFFYSDMADNTGTPNWNESRTVWNTTGSLNGQPNTLPPDVIGIETVSAGVTGFTKSANVNAVPPDKNRLTATASFRICNNWDRAITVVGLSDPNPSMVWNMMTEDELKKNYTPSLQNWLDDGASGQLTGPWGEAVKVLWGGSGNAAVQTTKWETRIANGRTIWDANNGYNAPSFPTGITIEPGESQPIDNPGRLTFGISTGSNLGTSTADIVVALFTMNFGLDVGFTY